MNSLVLNLVIIYITFIILNHLLLLLCCYEYVIHYYEHYVICQYYRYHYFVSNYYYYCDYPYVYVFIYFVIVSDVLPITIINIYAHYDQKESDIDINRDIIYDIYIYINIIDPIHIPFFLQENHLHIAN